MNLQNFKKYRIVVSLIFFAFLLAFFLDIHSSVINPVAELLLRLQFFPSLLRFTAMFFSVAAMGFVLVLLITFLWGRVYCSSICPMGTFQDIVISLSSKFKTRKQRRFYYSPNRKLLLRYGILAATLIMWIFGSLFLLNLLDPYSNFGKISVTIFQPIFSWVNNLVSFTLARFENYSVAPVMAKKLPADVLAISGGIFLTIVVLSVWRGRLFCNTLCPVGSVLGLVSRKSYYQIAFDDTACTMCGKCERVCKAECIDSKAKTVDNGRCVSCFNCFASCANHGLHYQKAYASPKQIKNQTQNIDRSKRTFLLTMAGGILSVPILNKVNLAQGHHKPGMIPTGTKLPVLPPGALNYDNFTSKCIACYLCVSACPKNVIVPSFFDYGLEGFMQPKLDFHKSYCNFDCVKCTEVCPTGALRKLDIPAKKTTQLGIARFMYESCIVTVDRTDCGACSEHCPTKAVSMIPYHGLRLPEVVPDLCIGCGACEFACPTMPYKAIYVESNRVHQEAIAIVDDRGPREHDQDEFPF
jgi:ferredoxin